MPQIDFVEDLIRLDRIAKTDGRNYPLKRFLYVRLKQILTSTRQFVGITGLRGTGKTVLLRQLASELDQSFYINADILPAGTDLFSLIIRLTESYGTRYLMVDEIHAIQGWQGQLKKIYDFSDIKITFTSSSSLELSEIRHDLSGILTLLSLPLFSFREYLLFKEGAELPVISLEEILANHQQFYKKIYPFEPDFREFFFLGALPACLKSPLPSVVTSVVDKVVQLDLLTAAKLSQEDILNIRATLHFIARAGVDGCSYSTVSQNLGITKYKAQQYIALMQSTFLIKIILPYGASVMPEPKILLAPSLRINLAQGSDRNMFTGSIREEFFIHHIAEAGYTVNYLKSARGEKLPAYIVFLGERRIIFEIGNGGKGASQFKGIVEKEKYMLNQPGSSSGIPLILTGFLW